MMLERGRARRKDPFPLGVSPLWRCWREEGRSSGPQLGRVPELPVWLGPLRLGIDHYCFPLSSLA